MKYMRIGVFCMAVMMIFILQARADEPVVTDEPAVAEEPVVSEIPIDTEAPVIVGVKPEDETPERVLALVDLILNSLPFYDEGTLIGYVGNLDFLWSGEEEVLQAWRIKNGEVTWVGTSEVNLAFGPNRFFWPSRTYLFSFEIGEGEDGAILADVILDTYYSRGLLPTSRGGMRERWVAQWARDGEPGWEIIDIRGDIVWD